MLIKKILNNNVILSENTAKQEIVAMGCGIAFKKKVGEVVTDSLIDKIYTYSDHEMLEKLKMLLADLPIEYMEISNEIISMAEKKLNKKLNDSIYISLTDHIHMAVERFKNGNFVRNMMVWETQRFYPDEFAIGKEAVAKINKKFTINMPEDEAGFIALHIVDAYMEKGQPLADHIMRLMEDILNIVRYTAHIEFDSSSIQYYRFVTHLKFFAKRIFQKLETKNEIDEEIVKFIKDKYGIADLCVTRIADFIEQKYHYHINSDERFYLMIHITKIIYKK